MSIPLIKGVLWMSEPALGEYERLAPTGPHTWKEGGRFRDSRKEIEKEWLGRWEGMCHCGIRGITKRSDVVGQVRYGLTSVSQTQRGHSGVAKPALKWAWGWVCWVEE